MPIPMPHVALTLTPVEAMQLGRLLQMQPVDPQFVMPLSARMSAQLINADAPESTDLVIETPETVLALKIRYLILDPAAQARANSSN